MKNNKGFTLVELLVVILIVSILMAVAVPTFLGARKIAQDNVAKQALANAARAAVTYYFLEDKFPPKAVNTDPGVGDSMESIEGTYEYNLDTSGSGALANANPPKIAYDPTNEELRTKSQSDTVWFIDISGGKVGKIDSE